MFYQFATPQTIAKPVHALICLTPAESKRLIAKGVAAMPEVKKAMKSGTVIIARGVTNAYVAEELTGERIDPKWIYAAGIVADGELMTTRSAARRKPIVLRGGQNTDLDVNKILPDLGADDVFIKGANALDHEGNAGVLVAGLNGGTIGTSQTVLQTKGILLLVPVGLEKLVPSVPEAARWCGIFRFKYSTGFPLSMITMPSAVVFTEIQALQTLFGVCAVMVGGGGNAGCEGAVILSVSGETLQIEATMNLVKAIKGEPPTTRPERDKPLGSEVGYDAAKQRG